MRPHSILCLAMLGVAFAASAQDQTRATPPTDPAVSEPAAPDQIPTRPRVITSLDMLITDEVRAAIGEARTLDDPIARGRLQKAMRAAADYSILDLDVPVGNAEVSTNSQGGPTWDCSFSFYGLVDKLGQRVRINDMEMPVVITDAYSLMHIQSDSAYGAQSQTISGSISTDDESIAQWAADLKPGEPVNIRARVETVSIVRLPRYSTFDEKVLFPPKASGTSKWSIVITVKNSVGVSRPKTVPKPTESTPIKQEAAPVRQGGE